MVSALQEFRGLGIEFVSLHEGVVCRLLCEKNSEREGWLRLRDMPDMPLSNTKLMTARFPMTATLTDSGGRTLELMITA